MKSWHPHRILLWSRAAMPMGQCCPCAYPKHDTCQIPSAPLGFPPGLRQPNHPCSPLPCCIVSYFCSVYNTFMFACRFSFFHLEEPQPTKMSCFGKLFHTVGRFSKSSFTLFQSCFVHCYEVKGTTAACMT